jgi:ABC-type transport system substrate-binding protein
MHRPAARRAIGRPRSMPASTLCVLLVACATPQRGQPGAEADTPASRATPKRVVTAIMVEPSVLYRPLIPGSYVIQTADLADSILHVGLTTFDAQGVLVPRTAEAVPSVENGLWRVNPSGEMELVWKIRPGTTWHDGTPFTTDDLLFTVQLAQDPNLPEFWGGASDVWDLITGVRALDP